MLADLLHPPQAILALADGTVFRGQSIGATGQTVGEVVFNTALTGYQEILSDPSYCKQIVTLTYPHIGSYGISEEDVEASKVFAAGLVIKDLPLRASNFRSGKTLDTYLREQGTVAIAGLDTRRLTRYLRERGANLSAGQRQLLSFARALAHGADVLVLDEATSSIDTETEQLSPQAVERVMAERTSLVVAHRL